MKKVSLPVKIGMLMALAMILIAATGYLSYRSLSSIVASIQVKSKPDMRLLSIREISTDLDKAENSVRMFIHTGRQKDIEPYYATIAAFDDKINRLRMASSHDTTLLTQIDTISKLIEEDILIWDKMLNLYHSDSLDNFIQTLTAKLAVGTLSNKNNEKSILKRVFNRKTENKLDQEEIIRDLNTIERQDSIKNKRLLATESQLAITGNEIRDRFYILISKMEEELISTTKDNAIAADRLAIKTYHWLAMFVVAGTLLVILVLLIVVRFVRKTHDYQLALINSKEETEKLSRTRELFMANMSHEIRTPVNAIYGFTEQLLYESFNEKNRNILDIIKSSSDHLVKLVNDILDFSKLQHAQITLEETHFLISRIFEEVQLLFEKKAIENNTKLFYIISKATPLVLFGDSYRLKQILFNLVGNAVKFTSNGEIHFSLDCEIKSGKNLNLILNIEDTGIGISDDMQDKVFGDFTQAEANTTRKYGGTGLGLSIVKKLVELHQGTVTLKSRKNIGTTITCIMPYSSGDMEQLPAIDKTLQVPDGIKNLKILIVDDEEYNRLLFKTIFNRWNISFDEAPDGIEAIDMIKTTRYDLVFMDVRMPGLDGLKSTTYIRNELKKSLEELPVIGISATHSTSDLHEYKLSGMNTFLSKPFTEKMLLEVILSIVEPTAEKTNIADIPQPGESSETKHKVNLDNLYHLANNDIPFVKNMLIRFIESTEQGLTEIHEAVSIGNIEAAMETAHKISSPCRHLGAAGLYNYLKAIEKEANNNKNLTILVKMYENSNREFVEIKKILNQYIEKIDA